MVYSEQDIQSHILEGKDLPKLDFGEKVEEMKDEMINEQYKNFTRVAALLVSLEATEQITIENFQDKCFEISDLISEINPSLEVKLDGFIKGLQLNAILWKIAGVDEEASDLGRSYLNGTISWPGIKEVGTACDHHYSRIFIIPPVENLHEKLLDFIEKKIWEEPDLPKDFEIKASQPYKVFATSSMYKSPLAPNELSGPISTYGAQLMEKMRNLRADNPNCQLQGMNLDEFMLDQTAKYLEHEELYLDPKRRKDTFLEGFMRPMYLLGEMRDGKYLTIKNSMRGFRFEYSADDGPDVALKVSFTREGLINGL